MPTFCHLGAPFEGELNGEGPAFVGNAAAGVVVNPVEGEETP